MAIILQYLMTDNIQQKPEGWYCCFSKDTPADKALEQFTKRFKSQPKENFIYKNLLWLGPIDGPEYSPTVGKKSLNLQRRIDSHRGRKEDEQ